MSEYTPTGHILFKDGDENIPSAIKDRNGKVALDMCKLCGMAQSELDMPCFDLLKIIDQAKKAKPEDPFVVQELINKADLYRERNALYGDNYKQIGAAFESIMGLTTLRTPSDYNRFAILVQVFGKITRYANMFDRGGHDDSLDDICVYAMMLKELDADRKDKK